MIPVVWLSLPAETPCRGYWDQGLLEAIFAREVWRPVDALEFAHTETHDPDAVPESGAVLVIPGRYHASDEHLGALRGLLRRMAWAVVILTGDEEGAVDFGWLRVHDRVRVWTQTPSLARPAPDGGLENGWPPGIRDVLAEIDPVAAGDRRWNWAFLGQVTHERRTEAAHALQRVDGGHLVETAGFTEGIPQVDYWAKLAQAKIAPCPSGPCTVDTFRVYEALEAGCVPLVDGALPGGVNQHGYWPLVFGDVPPFPIIMDWDRDTAGEVARINRRWPVDANVASAWWQARKRDLAYRLDDTVREVAQLGIHRNDQSPSGLVTVIVTTSATPFHPDTAHLEETLASVRDRLPDAEVLLVADGLRPELDHRRRSYDEYLRRVCWAANLQWRNVLPILLPAWMHQANATRAALREVKTPLVLFVEHDTPLVGDIDWGPLTEVLLAGEANLVRFYHEVEVHPEHAHLMLDGVHPVQSWRRDRDGLRIEAPMIRTVQWSQRPHLARTDFYRDRILPCFRRKGRTMIEDVMHGIVANDYVRRGEAAWWDWRLWLYHPADSSPLGVKRSTHLDSRGDDPKFAMVP